MRVLSSFLSATTTTTTTRVLSRRRLCSAGAAFSVCRSTRHRDHNRNDNRRQQLATGVAAAALLYSTTTTTTQMESDPYEWLESIEGDEALDWVRSENSRTFAKWGEPTKSPRYSKILDALESKEKIPGVRKLGKYYYNFWTDAEHPRGILRRVKTEDYILNEPPWDIVLDIDALGKAENVSWVYKGHTPYRPFGGEDQEVTRTIVSLSPGGSDAIIRREFDFTTKSFVKEGGFHIETPSKNRLSWIDEDTVLVGVDLVGESDLTTSGYPRVVREWKRTEPLDPEILPTVYQGEPTDVSVSGAVSRSRGIQFEWRIRSTSFYTSMRQVRRHDSQRTGVWYDLNKLGIPEDAMISHFGDAILVELRTDWESYKAGSLLAVDFSDLTKKGPTAAFTKVFEPDDHTSLEGFAASKDILALVIQEDVKTRLEFKSIDDKLRVTNVVPPTDPKIYSVGLSAVDSEVSNDFFIRTSSFLEPSTLSLMRFKDSKFETETLKKLPSMFEASKTHEVSQSFATSKDGTKVPYFIVQHKDKKNSAPCLVYGYGGFEISLGPSYTPSIGRGWLDRGGTYVIANLRGGGEYGPSWHQAALKENRQRAYDDLHAVAEDLITTGIVESSKSMAIRGGSNGGLLVANAYVQRPDLYGAVVCAVPLINMKRYTKLLAGASWAAEYGDPDTDDWDNFLSKYSPYHNIGDAKERATYPPLLVTTSTKDDRVHPAHARSFVKKLRDLGVDNVWYYENIEGGHGGAADAKQAAFTSALYLDFLYDTLSGQ